MESRVRWLNPSQRPAICYIITFGQHDIGFELLGQFVDERAEIATTDIRRDHRAAFAILAADLVRPRRERYLRKLRKRHEAAGRKRNGEIAERREVGANGLGKPDDDVDKPVALDELARLPPASRGRTRNLDRLHAHALARHPEAQTPSV